MNVFCQYVKAIWQGAIEGAGSGLIGSLLIVFVIFLIGRLFISC